MPVYWGDFVINQLRPIWMVLSLVSTLGLDKHFSAWGGDVRGLWGIVGHLSEHRLCIHGYVASWHLFPTIIHSYHVLLWICMPFCCRLPNSLYRPLYAWIYWWLFSWQNLECYHMPQLPEYSTFKASTSDARRDNSTQAVCPWARAPITWSYWACKLLPAEILSL